jgi:hypothetical protein
VKPGDGAKQSKEHEGKTYHWCPNHGFWTLHHPKDCTAKPVGEKKVTPSPSQKLTFAEAALAAMDSDDDDDSSHA